MAPPVLAAPSGGSIAYQATNISKADQVLSLTVNNGATTGTVSPSLLRRETTLMQGTCGTTYSLWETVPFSGTIPNITTTNFGQEKCYQFAWQVTDDSGTTSFPSTVIVTTKPNIIPLQTVSVGKAIFVKLNDNNLFVSLNPICTTPVITATKYIFEEGDKVTLIATPDGIAGSCTWSADNDDLTTATYLDTNHCIIKVSPTQNTTYTVTMQSCQNTASTTIALKGSPISDGTMQGFADCYNYETPAIADGATFVGNLTDTRDGKTYEIRKMPDGKCWMVDNLAYGGGTDGSSDYCVGKTTVGDWREANSQANSVANTTNGLNPTDGSRNTLVGNCSNAGSTTSYCQLEGAGAGKCGYWYNWSAAMQSDLAYYNSTTVFNGVQQGICPSGWHLPTSAEFVSLDKAFGGTGENRSGASTFVEAHYINQGQFKGLYSGVANYTNAAPTCGTSFPLWSSTYSSGTIAYSLAVGTSAEVLTLNPYGYKSYGYAVRCITDTHQAPITSSTTMQEWDDCVNYATPDANGATHIGEMKDARDGKSYEIRKMPDGKCWMVDNLAYGGGTDGSSDYCAAKTTTAGWRDATSQTLASAVATNGLNPTDGSRNTLMGNCSNAGATTAYCQTAGHKCGYWYNWAAAIQSDLAYYGSSAGFPGVWQGICPEGWHLPHTTETVNLDKAFGGSGNNRENALSFIEAHYLNPNQFKGIFPGEIGSSSGGATNQGVTFRLWTSVASSYTSYAYDLSEFSSGLMRPAYNDNKSSGFLVRCIKD